jgi:MFS family permease
VSAFCWPTLAIPGLILFTTSHVLTIAMAGWAMFQLANGLSFGSAYAIIQEIVPSRMKGRATALWYLINALGTSMGTLVTAIGTQYLFKDPAAIPQAIQIMAAPAVIIGICFMWFGLKPFDRARHAVHAMR